MKTFHLFNKQKKLNLNSTVQCAVLVLFLVLHVVNSAFTPGCSFFNGQCVYNVKLGHEGQCDSVQHAASAAPSASGHLDGGDCTCNDVQVAKNDLATLQGTVSQLQKAVDQLYKQLNLTKTELAQTNQQVTTETTGNADLLSTLHLKEVALNQTDHELASVLNTAGAEIKSMREQLQNATRDLSVCQGVVNPNGHTSLPTMNEEYKTFYCPFQDSSLCGFRQEYGDDGDWLFSKGTLHFSTGPKMDHTYGSPSGYYMSMDPQTQTSSSQHTRHFRLVSPIMKSANNYCIKFWYNMYGTDVKDLKVYAKVNGGLGNPIFSRRGNLGQDWHLAEIDLNDEYTKTDFNIVFEASADSYRSYVYSSSTGSHQYVYHKEKGSIAIDDFYAYNTTCNSVPTCPPSSYKRTVGNVTSCVNFNSAPLSWYAASQSCKKESAHAHLMTIPDGQTQNYLIQLIQNDIGLMAAGQSGYYISASDEKTEGSFVWTDTGTPYSVNYTSWHAGQPNNVGSNQDCVLMEYPAADYEWGDVDCRTQHPYICEINY